ncbi:FMN-binding negative transcriptional regulator [Halalkalibacterium ligniniphilum]|uniref:FMN-binding negative transcriptional regulator n=1 Tax=Halalkalibacterium ligniniphilum TaxID=1134413 RepID=UPI00034B30A5|nr:FMN-binding negative transcriptional regulator [Halalkalibacterium ligniniphilum]
MYIPKAFEESDKQVLADFIKTNSFGILFSQEMDGPFATHLPFLLEEYKKDNGVLISHMAKANPHWQQLDGKEVLVVFPGPHAYISASWYHEENTVPTWNYVTAHVTGTVRVIKAKDELVELIEKTVAAYEDPMPAPWKANVQEPFIDGLMNGIVGFEIMVKKIEGKWKLNQNHSIERMQNAVNGLKESNQIHAYDIAALMEEKINEKQNKRLGDNERV